jgi:hypothetical protein
LSLTDEELEDNSDDYSEPSSEGDLDEDSA